MPCYHPRTGYKSADLTANGKRQIVYNPHKSLDRVPMKVACQNCIGCRLEYARQWAIRCVHEAQQFESNCFITLTYDDLHLPYERSLVKKHYQDFMKRLRRHYSGLEPVIVVNDTTLEEKLCFPIRYFHCGEYGEKRGRPHYHACVFNFDFPDKVFWKNVRGHDLYLSPSLTEIWGKGMAVIGDCTFESAAYVARYIVKKINGNMAADHYTRVHPDTGEILHILPEYTTMSRKKGIGRLWFDEYSGEVYPDDFVVIRGRKMKPPKYYDRLLEKTDLSSYEIIKRSRKLLAKNNIDNTEIRLQDREKVTLAKLNLYSREVD